MNVKEIIGQNIQRNREQKGMKQDTLAKLLNITPAALSQLETGKTDPTVTRIEQVDNALEKNFYEIMGSPNQVVSIHNSPNSCWNNSSVVATEPKLVEAVIGLCNRVITLLENQNKQ